MKKYLLEITTFISGAIGMIIELIAARILSPYLGSSNLIWTCIIGMMLAFMSLGYFIGGKFADKYPNINVLSLFILVASIFISLIPLLEINIIEPLSKTSLPATLVAVISSTLTFGIPSLFLSTVSPFAVKLIDKKLEEVGKVSGNISAFSTIGSIAGTFLAGFVLIPLIGIKNIILGVVIVLFILSFVLYKDKNIKYILKSIVIFIILIFIVVCGKYLFFKTHTDIILDTDSEYSRIWLKSIESNGQKFYALQVDTAYESVATENNQMTDNYLKYYDLFDYYNKNTSDILMIGGAAYVYPNYYLKKFPDKRIDVVEIDPKMTEISKKYFALDDQNTRINIYHEDGRKYLNNSDKKYDCILIDAFKGTNAPFQLTTLEAMYNAKRSLNDNGIVITNVISAVDGTKSDFIKYEFSTYKAIFDDVKVFKVSNDIDNQELQNLILIAFKNKNSENDPEKYEVYKNLIETEIVNFESDKNIVTDDLCPIGA